jgi:phosphopentomutase
MLVNYSVVILSKTVKHEKVSLKQTMATLRQSVCSLLVTRIKSFGTIESEQGYCKRR